MAKRRSNTEAAIQRAVMEHLRARAKPGVVYCHVPNGGKRNVVEAANFKRMGVRAGMPDLLFWYDGKSFALELKSEGEYPTELQYQRIDELNNAGCYATWAAGLNAVLRVLNAWGLMRERAV